MSSADVKCPKCDTKFEHDFCDDMPGQDDEVEIECHKCGVDIKAVAYWSLNIIGEYVEGLTPKSEASGE